MTAWLPVAAYAALIALLSSTPQLAPPGSGAGLDKVAHLVEFGMMGGLLARAWALSGVDSPLRRIGFALMTGAVLAVLDERFQGLFGRETSTADWIADVLGVTLGAGLDTWFRRERS